MSLNDTAALHLTTDSGAYHVLVEAVMRAKSAPGLICEIGTRRGGSAKFIIDALVENQDTDRTLVCIDPYGNITYMDRDNMPVQFDYTNDMRRETIPLLTAYAYAKIKNFIFFNLEDTEFFERFADGVPTYNNGKEKTNKYACVFFDGPHDYDSVCKEVQFFLPRTSVNSTFIFDDISDNRYDHDKIETDYLFCNGWEPLNHSAPKKSYVKVR